MSTFQSSSFACAATAAVPSIFFTKLPTPVMSFSTILFKQKSGAAASDTLSGKAGALASNVRSCREGGTPQVHKEHWWKGY